MLRCLRQPRGETWKTQGPAWRRRTTVHGFTGLLPGGSRPRFAAGGNTDHPQLAWTPLWSRLQGDCKHTCSIFRPLSNIRTDTVLSHGRLETSRSLASLGGRSTSRRLFPSLGKPSPGRALREQERLPGSPMPDKEAGVRWELFLNIEWFSVINVVYRVVKREKFAERWQQRRAWPLRTSAKRTVETV